MGVRDAWAFSYDQTSIWRRSPSLLSLVTRRELADACLPMHTDRRRFHEDNNGFCRPFNYPAPCLQNVRTPGIARFCVLSYYDARVRSVVNTCKTEVTGLFMDDSLTSNGNAEAGETIK